MNKPSIWRAVFWLALFYFNPVHAATTAGVIELVEGDVKITRGGNPTLEPILGDSLEEGDTIVTGADGELQVSMEDGGFIAVRPNTRMKIEAYRAEGDADDKSILSLFQGTFRSITGWIGKYSRNNYQIKAPNATIGIRGTDHEPLYIPENAVGPEGEPGLYDKVNQGESFIQNQQGKIFVKTNQSGFVPHHGRTAPRLLARIPGFFRATRNEQRILQKRETLKKQIERRRLERRKFIQQKRTEQRKKLIEEKTRRQKQKREELLKQRQHGEHSAKEKKQQLERLQEMRKEREGRAERQGSDDKRRLKEKNRRELDEDGRDDQRRGGRDFDRESERGGDGRPGGGDHRGRHSSGHRQDL
ncbi:MAG TPA: FecR domain-containing protein [Burkholderiales bacterium]|nr:FecR domain-containing protein [Burkholderiales bacterium]